MTITARLTFDDPVDFVPAIEEYRAFCDEFSIRVNSDASDGMFDMLGQLDDVLCHFWRGSVMFVANDGDAIGTLARLAKKAWCRWGGAVTADKTIRRAMVCGKVTE